MDLFNNIHLQWTKLHGSLHVPEKHSIMEAINWVCPSAQDNHAWTSEFSLVLHETKTLAESKKNDTEVPCNVQLVLLWHVASTSPNHHLG